MAVAVRLDRHARPLPPPDLRARRAGGVAPTHEIHRGCTLRIGREASRIRARTLAPGSLRAARLVLPILAVAPLGGVLFPDPPASALELPLAVRDTAALLWVLCFLPALHYLRQPAHRRPPLPILAIMGVEYGMYYALAPLLGMDNVHGVWDEGRMIAWLDPARDYLVPIRLALGGWLAILAGYAIARAVPLPGVRAAEPLGRQFDDRTLAEIGFRFVAYGIGFELLRWTGEVPLVLQGTLHFLARVTLLGIALLHAVNARGALTPRQRRRLYLATGAVLLIEFGTGATYNVILVVFFAFVGRWIGRPAAGPRLVLGAVAALALFVSVRGVMIDFRRMTWWNGTDLPLLERSRIMIGLLGERVEELGPIGTVNDGVRKVAERSANSDLLADVVRRTPYEIPFWNGATYHSLVGLAIPRFLWPDKPVKNLGQDFGHRYHYLAEQDKRTQINLPLLIEFYANFGRSGLILGSLLAGLLYKLVERYVNRPRQSLLVSIGGLSLLQPLLVLELDFSLQLGGVFMNAIALFALYRIVCARWGDHRLAGRLGSRAPFLPETSGPRSAPRRPDLTTPATSPT